VHLYVLAWRADSNYLDQNQKEELAMDESKDTSQSKDTSSTDILTRGKTLPQYAAAIIGKYFTYNIRNLGCYFK
jgi:hypothetical protein